MQRLGSSYTKRSVWIEKKIKKKKSLYETLERRIEELRTREWAIDGSFDYSSSFSMMMLRPTCFFFSPNLRNDGVLYMLLAIFRQLCFWILFSLIWKYLISVFVRPEICRDDDLAKKKKWGKIAELSLHISSTSVHSAHTQNNNKNFEHAIWSTHKIRLTLCIEHQDKYTAAADYSLCVCAHSTHIFHLSAADVSDVVYIYLTQRWISNLMLLPWKSLLKITRSFRDLI